MKLAFCRIQNAVLEDLCNRYSKRAFRIQDLPFCELIFSQRSQIEKSLAWCMRSIDVGIAGEAVRSVDRERVSFQCKSPNIAEARSERRR